MVVPALMMVVVRRANLGIERRVDRSETRAEAGRHLLQHVIAPDAKPVAHDLHIGMAIAEVPSEPNERQWRLRRHLDQRLGLTRDPHDPAVIEHEPIAVAQGLRPCEVEQEHGTPLAGEHDPPPLAVAGIEHDAVDGDPVPRSHAPDGGHAPHPGLPFAINLFHPICRTVTFLHKQRARRADLHTATSDITGAEYLRGLRELALPRWAIHL
jgi:hypothetical protein